MERISLKKKTISVIMATMVILSALPMQSVLAADEIVVSIADIPGVTVPVAGQTPVADITETEQYTGKVTWDLEEANFDYDTEYTASVELTAKAGYTLVGIAENFFKVAGATSVTNAIDSGKVTVVFPATEEDDNDLYRLTVRAGRGGRIVEAASGLYEAGDEVDISARANNNYVFDYWEASGSRYQDNFDDEYDRTTEFTMPARDITVTAYFEDEDDYDYYAPNRSGSSRSSGGSISGGTGSSSSTTANPNVPAVSPIARPTAGTDPISSADTAAPEVPAYVSAQDAQVLSMKINGLQFYFAGQQPIRLYGTALVPARETFGALECTVTWDANSQTATIRGRNAVITVKNGNDYCTINGFNSDMGGRAQIVNGSIMVPFATLMEGIGCHAYLDAGNVINVNYVEEF